MKILRETLFGVINDATWSFEVRCNGDVKYDYTRSHPVFRGLQNHSVVAALVSDLNTVKNLFVGNCRLSRLILAENRNRNRRWPATASFRQSQLSGGPSSEN